MIRRLAALCSEEIIGADVIAAELTDSVAVAPSYEEPSNESLGEAVDRHLKDFFAAHKDGLPPPGLYDRVVQEVERPLINLCLTATRGNQIKAAHILGLNRNTLRKKIRELDIQVVRGVR